MLSFFFLFKKKVFPNVSPSWNDNGFWEIQHLCCGDWRCCFSLVLQKALVPVDVGEWGLSLVWHETPVYCLMEAATSLSPGALCDNRLVSQVNSCLL